MNQKIIINGNAKAVVVQSKDILITDAVSALDFMMSIQYENDCQNIALNKEAFDESFFVLSNGIAGEILQKFTNYGIRLAIYGDFSKYSSKPLHDFMLESNKGNQIFFQPDEETAIAKLIGKK